MARLPGLGVARTGVVLLVLVVLVGVALLAYVRPTGPGGDGTPSPTLAAGNIATPTPPARPTEAPRELVTPTPPASEPTERPHWPPTPGPGLGDVVAELTNPDGPNPDDYPVDGYPFIEIAYGLPNYALLWIDRNQRDVHLAVTRDVDGAIEAIRDGVPRGITVYLHLADHSQRDLCALQDEIFGDREDLMQYGILLTSGGCGNLENRVNIGMSPLTPEAVAFMQRRYSGPIDYEAGGASALERVDPPADGDVRLLAVRGDDLGFETCGRRPFPAGATGGAAADLSGAGPEYAALRDALARYVDVYGDLTALKWILVESDRFGATFMADRGDTWLEAPVFASSRGWVPGTIDYCEPRALTLDDGGMASVYLDPAFPRPGPNATEIHVLVNEQACAGASSPASRLLPPVVRYTENELHLTVTVRPVGGGATCPGNPSLPVTIVLPEPLGDRRLAGVADRPEH